LLAETLESWITAAGSDDASWRVYGIEAANVLGFGLGAAYTNPEDPTTFQIIRSVIQPNDMHSVYETIWPAIRQRLQNAPDGVVAQVIDAASEWLRIGAGYDRPFGNSHPEDAIATSSALGRQLLEELSEIVQDRPGLRRKIVAIADRHGVQVGPWSPSPDDAFFGDFDPAGDWRENFERLENAIRDTVQEWPLANSAEVIQRLTALKPALAAAGATWPDRLRVAFGVIAPDLDSRRQWIEEALEASLFPHAGPLIAEAVRAEESLPMDLWQNCWRDTGARWEALAVALAYVVPDEVRTAAIQELQARDFSLLETMILRKELSDERIGELLVECADSARGAVAAAMFAGTRHASPFALGDLQEAWLAAVVHLDFLETKGLNPWTVGELFEFMSESFPNRLVDLVEARLRNRSESSAYQSLPDEAWHALHRLPSEQKTSLWRALRDDPSLQWLLNQYLVGEDVEWLTEMLDSGDFDLSTALASYSAFGPRPRLEELATLLVPRGVDPAQIAGLAQSGTWSGEESSRYATLVERFSQMADSADPSVSAVGRAGSEIFSEARDLALERERTRRVRGELR
jgi:hypothetical protein